MAKKVRWSKKPYWISVSSITPTDMQRYLHGRVSLFHGSDPIYVYKDRSVHDGNARLGKAVRKGKKWIKAYIEE